MKLRNYIALGTLIFGSFIALYSQENPTEPFYIKVPLKNIRQPENLPGIYHREDITKKSIRLLVTHDQFDSIKAQYPEVKILKAAPALDESDMATDFDEALTFNKYPTYEQYDSMMHHFAETYPQICKIDTIGKSIQGRLILALKISDNVHVPEDEPSFFYTSTIHGDELVGYNLTLRFIDFLLSNYPMNAEVERIINEVEIWINPLSNPDGTYYPNNNATVAYSIRGNANGYDLNRNFPDVSTGIPENNAPIQIETQQMIDFMAGERFNMSANLHSGAEVVNYPWDHTYSLHPDNEWFILISREYADEARVYNSAYMDDFTNGITNGAAWYIISGGRQDYVTYFLQGRELTLELSNTKKILSANLETYWNYNKWSFVNLISQARYGIHGKISSAVSGIPLGAKIYIAQHDDSSSWVVSDTIFGSFYRYLKEGTYDLVISSDGYISDTVKNVGVFDYQRTKLDIQLDTTSKLKVNNKDLIEFKVFPNPVENTFYIHSNKAFDKAIKYIIYDSTGRIAIAGSLSPGKNMYPINAESLATGIYHLKIQTREKIYVKTISKY